MVQNRLGIYFSNDIIPIVKRNKLMNQLNKKIKINLIVGILISLMFVACIPMIILSAFDIKRSLVTFVFSIVCMFAGFYGLPFVWTNFQRLRNMKKTWALIQEGVTDYQSLSGKLKMSPRRTRKYVNRLFRFGYISAVEITEEPIYGFEKKTFEARPIKCEGCGGVYVKNTNDTECPYCNKYN